MSDNGLVQISSMKKTGEKKAGDMSRRTFLKVLGAAGAAGATACADSSKQNIFPNVKGDNYQVPGVATWFRSTCLECSANCGITVRNREGRAVKVEGNRENPVAEGGLCGLGQASLQALYNPDRIREPLEKVVDGEKATFKPITWKAAYKKVQAALKKADGKFAFLTGETTGSLDTLVTDFTKSLNGTRAVYDVLQPVAEAKASERVYGTYGVPYYDFEKAEVVLNFGADFLETWVSPVGNARGWAKGRKADHLSKVFHVEPRLSLTGANADKWLCNKPGSELEIALAVLKTLHGWGLGKNLSEDVNGRIAKLVQDVKISDVAKSSGVSEEKILLVSKHLKESKHSLVLSGGAAGRGGDALGLATVTALLNLVLANVGSTVDISRMRKPKSLIGDVEKVLQSLDSGDVELLFVHGTNPAFTLPSDFGFSYALSSARTKKVAAERGDLPLLVSFASELDETAEQADIILPAHHFLEDWGDANPLAGINSLVQPVMTPVFNTRSFGDSLLTLAGKGVSEAKDYKSFVQKQWEELHGSVGSSLTFSKWWAECLERGGYFKAASKPVKVTVSKDAYNVKPAKKVKMTKGAKSEALHVLTYPSVKTFDGRAANRPWLQELPDPVTKAVWDSWAEIHPETAKKYGLSQGDGVILRNYYGEVNVPVYVTEHVHPDVVAVPLGQGHSSYGRFAKEVAGVGNILSLFPKSATSAGALALSGVTAKPVKSRTPSILVRTQTENSQHDRHLARTKYVEAKSHGDHGHHGSNGHHEGGHHEVKQMYEQREHPLYEWGLNVDLAACTGCGSCVVACYAENNIPTVGKEVVYQGREMSWLRIERYFDQPAEELKVSFLPMMCQQCNNAPCEPVCPVYATYHNEEGLNSMVYNRCVGTRYCSNNCTYKVRRFNWYDYEFPEPMQLQLNPDVTKRMAGVMEKCTFCIQRIQEGKNTAKNEGRVVQDGDIQPACVQSCPTEALSFGNRNDKKSAVSKGEHSERAYKVLDHHINTQPSVVYMEDLRFKV